MRYRRDRHSMKLDKVNHMQELEEEKPSKCAVKAFKHKAYTIDTEKDKFNKR